MRVLQSIDSTDFDGLVRLLEGMGNRLVLVKASGKKVLLYGSGRVVRKYREPEGELRDVEIVELEKFEFLDLLTEGEEEKAEEPSEDTKTGPVTFSYSLEAPKGLYLSIEAGLLKGVSKAYRDLDVAIGDARIKASVIYGATGRDILFIRARLKAFSAGEVGKRELERVLSEEISRETGFYTRAIVEELELEKVPRKPLLKLPSRQINFRGGRIIEVPLGRGKSPGIDRKRVEAEVERLLREAGVEELSEKLGGGKKGRVSIREIERLLLERLSGVRGMKVNWVRVSPLGDDGFQVAVGASRTSRSTSDTELSRLVGEAIKMAEKDGRVRGVAFRVEEAFLVIEKDVY
ncbi:hypothetical protein A3L12_01945 [Thermococcus sp. P6]|nr:hypothetical protein A3L12_01945 [Thermococcus sp. P6]